MIYKARKEKWPVIDCTPSVMIVHQNHDYSHLPGGKPHYEHPDTNENIRLAGGAGRTSVTRFWIQRINLSDGKLARPKMSSLRFMRGVELFLREIFFFLPENMIENIARPKTMEEENTEDYSEIDNSIHRHNSEIESSFSILIPRNLRTTDTEHA